MEFLSQYGLFLLKTFTVVVAFIIIFASFFSLSRKHKPKLEIKSINEEYDQLHTLMKKEILGEKKLKKRKKNKQKQPKLFLIDFKGDIKASQVEQLRDEITAILTVAQSNDEVVIRIESPGGSVNGYGLAAAQLQRIRDKKIHLTACIDKVAASGGYLMACVAHTIIAAPFSILGSIGVVAQLPNFHRWLKKNHIDMELLTAGEYKRTLTSFGENTEKDRQKFQEDLEKIHTAFRQYVLTNRSQLNIDEVSTGEHWLATDAFALRLVDKLQTSDDYITNRIQDYQAFKLVIHQKESFINKVLKPAMQFMHPFS